MVLSQTGKTAGRWRGRTEKKSPHVEPGEHVLMPNHMHGVVAIVGADPRVRPKRENADRNEYIKEVKSGSLPPFQKHIRQRSFHDRIICADEDMVRKWYEKAASATGCFIDMIASQ